MAKEDFCFTYYDGDAARDKAHMTRLQRGAYDDIISAQRKRGHLSIDDIKRVLSKDFEECWPALEWVLKKDEAQNFFIEWVDKSIEKMRKHSEKQKEKVNARWSKNKPDAYQNDTTVLPQNNHGTDSVIPLENEDGNGNKEENGFVEGGMGETFVPVIDEPFVIVQDLKLPDGILEAAEMNQFMRTRSKNTEFILAQWSIFVTERMLDPPERRHQYRQLSDLTTYFLNWIREKKPNAANRQTHTGSNSTKPGTSEARVQAAKDY